MKEHCECVCVECKWPADVIDIEPRPRSRPFLFVETVWRCEWPGPGEDNWTHVHCDAVESSVLHKLVKLLVAVPGVGAGPGVGSGPVEKMFDLSVDAKHLDDSEKDRSVEPVVSYRVSALVCSFRKSAELIDLEYRPVTVPFP